MSDKHMAREMTPQERAAAPVEVRQALADKVKNLIVSNLTHEENQLWLANVDAFEERAYQRGRRAALRDVLSDLDSLHWKEHWYADQLRKKINDRLVSEGA